MPPPDTFGQINNPRASNAGPANAQVGYNYIDAQGQTQLMGAMLTTLSSLAPAGLPFNINPSGGIATPILEGALFARFGG